VHECLDGFQMVLVGLDKKLPSWKSPHDWLVRLAIKVAAFCDIYSSIRLQTRPSGCVQIRKPAMHFMAFHPPQMAPNINPTLK